VRSPKDTPLSLGREVRFSGRRKNLWSPKSGPGLIEEFLNMLSDSLFFCRDEVKVSTVRIEFLGNAEHEMAQSGGDEGPIQRILTFWLHRCLPSL
jgi:hypothetical protein